MCVKSLLKMRITDSDSPEILYSSSANYVVYTMKSPKSNLVNLCNDREHKHSVKQGKHFVWELVEELNILLHLLEDVTLPVLWLLWNNNRSKAQSITLQTTDLGNLNCYIKLYAPVHAAGFSRVSVSWQRKINAQQHCWSDHTWHKSLQAEG